MFTHSIATPVSRATALATIAALVLTAAAPSMAVAAPQGKAAATSGATDFSARKRVAVRRGYRGGGAAAAAAVAGMVGTGLAIAAAQNRSAYYDDYYSGPYYGSPAYSAPGVYYGGGYAPYRYGW